MRLLLVALLVVGALFLNWHAVDAFSASPRCAGKAATIVGTTAADRLLGTPASDVIVGLAGDDTLIGLAGDDFLCGNGGNDRLIGGRGRDVLDGGRGRNACLGGERTRRCTPYPPAPPGGEQLPALCRGEVATLRGTDGNDTLIGTEGRDVVVGLRGNDVIKALGGNDVVCAGEGDDQLDGGFGKDILDGGAGANTCLGGEEDEACVSLASPPVWVFSDDLPQETQAEIRDAVALAAGWLEQNTGTRAKSVTVFAYTNVDALAQAHSEWFDIPGSFAVTRERFLGGGAEAGAGAIFIYTTGPVWLSMLSRSDRYGVVAHEYFHVAQSLLHKRYPEDFAIPHDQVRSQGPAWLVEGSANYVAHRVLADNGLLDYAAVRASAIADARSSAVPLNAMESNTGFASVGNLQWPISELAADFLVQQTGVPALLSFWDAIGRGSAWKDAFQSAFGQTVDSFYAGFEAYRRSQ